MPNTREKLIELLGKAQDSGTIVIPTGQGERYEWVSNQKVADYLIANGVVVSKMETATIATDNPVGDKLTPTEPLTNCQHWIPVTERLPDRDGQYLCNYHFGEHRTMTFTRVLDYYATDKVPHFQHTLGDTTMKVTHWMPLPEPPKGE